MLTSSLNLRRFAKTPKVIRGISAACAGILYLTVWLPVTGIGIPCVFHELTGLYCPGCGMTRAAQALLRLDFLQAWQNNALSIVLPPLAILYFWMGKRRMPRPREALMISMLIVAVAFGLARNVPAMAWLAP